MANDIHKRIRELYRTFSKSYKRIANLILHDYQSIVAVTSKEFAAKADVSESTVIRFAHSLGYSKYSDFQRAIHAVQVMNSTPLDNIISSKSSYSLMDFPASVFQSDIRDLKWTIEHIDARKFKTFTTSIITSTHVLIISNRETEAVARILADALRYSVESVSLIAELYSNDALLEIARLKSTDCVILIDYPPHNKSLSAILARITQYTQNTLALSDTKDSPASAYCSYAIVARTHPAAFNNSYISLIAVVNAIASDVARRNESKITERIKRLEALKNELNNTTKGSKC